MDRLTKKEQNITITADDYRLKPTEVQQLMKKSRKFADEAHKKHEAMHARNELEDLLNSVLAALEDDKVSTEKLLIHPPSLNF